MVNTYKTITTLYYYCKLVIFMTNFDYYSYRLNYATNTINKEIEFYANVEQANTPLIINYRNYLEIRIGKNRYEYSTISHIDARGNRQELRKMNFDEYSKDIDIMMFKKPWNKLKLFHKIMKIKDYIGKLNYNIKLDMKTIEANKKEIIDEISLGLQEKKFIKNKSNIDYDIQKMEITSISCLDYDKKKKLYYIDWDF